MPRYELDGCECCGCGGCRILVCVFNCNGITDDNFTLTLNGELIATMPETIADNFCEISQCRGHLVVPTGWTTTPEPAKCQTQQCTLPYLWQTITESTLLDNPPCELNFTLTSVQNNNCGNFGKFIVYRVCPIAGNFGELEQIYIADYNMFFPGSNEYSLTAPCCSSSSSSSPSSSSSSSSSFSSSSFSSSSSSLSSFSSFSSLSSFSSAVSSLDPTSSIDASGVSGFLTKQDDKKEPYQPPLSYKLSKSEEIRKKLLAHLKKGNEDRRKRSFESIQANAPKKGGCGCGKPKLKPNP